MVANTDRLFIDYNAWVAQLGQGAADHRASVEAELAAQVDRLSELERLEAKLRRRYLEALECDNPHHRAVESTLNEFLTDKDAYQDRVATLQEALAAQPDGLPTDAMLDVYNEIARAVRGGDSSPTVLWATEPPPVKPLSVPSETGPNTHA